MCSQVCATSTMLCKVLEIATRATAEPQKNSQQIVKNRLKVNQNGKIDKMQSNVPHNQRLSISILQQKHAHFHFQSANDEANADESPDRSTSSTAAEGNSGLLHEFREQWKAELTGAKDKQPAAAEHVPSKSHLSRTASSAATTTSHRRHHVHTDEEIVNALRIDDLLHFTNLMF